MDARREQAKVEGTVPTPAAGDWERMVLLATLAMGIYWAVGTTDFERTQPWNVALLLLGVIGVGAVLRGMPLAPWGVLAHAVAIGYAERITRKPFVGSDVLTATREAVEVLAAGGNPYAHTYLTNNPPGSPVPYLPGEMAFYAIPQWLFGTMQGMDKVAGIGVVILLAALAPAIGPARAALATALYGTFGLAAYRSTDGSNDTSLAFLVVLAVVLLAWSLRAEREPARAQQARALFYASALAFAWALLFKQFAWLIYPAVALALRRRGAAWRQHAIVSVGVPILVTLPFALTAPGGFVRHVLRGPLIHQNIWGLNLWAGLKAVDPGLPDAVNPMIAVLGLIALAAGALLIFLHPADDLGVALLQGLGLLFVALFLARWTTSTYYMFAAAVLAAAVGLVSAIPAPLPVASAALAARHEPEADILPTPQTRPEGARKRAARPPRPARARS